MQKQEEMNTEYQSHNYQIGVELKILNLTKQAVRVYFTLAKYGRVWLVENETSAHQWKDSAIAHESVCRRAATTNSPACPDTAADEECPIIEDMKQVQQRCLTFKIL